MLDYLYNIQEWRRMVCEVPRDVVKMPPGIRGLEAHMMFGSMAGASESMGAQQGSQIGYGIYMAAMIPWGWDSYLLSAGIVHDHKVRMYFETK